MKKINSAIILFLAILIVGTIAQAQTRPRALYVSDDLVNNYMLDLLDNDFDVILSFKTIPSNLSEYDLVVVESYAACSRTTADYLKTYVANGGGVYMNQGAPYFLAGSTDLSYIKEWFGARTYHNLGAGDIFNKVNVDNPFETGLPVNTLLYRFAKSWAGNAGVLGLEPGSIACSYWNDGSIAAFTHPYGSGRVFYYSQGASHPVIKGFPETLELRSEMDTFLEGGWKWAANLSLSPQIGIILDPDNTALHPGETLTITAIFKNNTSIARGFYFWTDCFLSNNTPLAMNPVYKQEYINIAASETKTITISHRIPANAPNGNFIYFGKVGIWLRQAFVVDSFEFNISD